MRKEYNHKPPTAPVGVGTPVWFLQFGQPHDIPLPATVVEISDQLICNLCVFNKDGMVISKQAVYPVGHRNLFDANGRPNQNASRNGAWTYNPLFVPEESNEEKIKELYKELGSVDEVFKRMRLKGVTKSEVTEVLSTVS